MSAVEATTGYPVQFSVDYPEHELNRLTTAFRIFVAIPILILVATVANASFQWTETASGEVTRTTATAGGVLFFPTLLMIVFRQKYPRWWYEWNLQFSRFVNRVYSYLLLLRDEYPATDDEQAVHLELPYPNVQTDLNRWLPLVKWLLAIPHYIILLFLVIAALFAVIIAWFAILFTGRYPLGLFAFVVGVMRWGNRVGGYAFILVTDRYPPFRLEP
jgi:hypothetical protein